MRKRWNLERIATSVAIPSVRNSLWVRVPALALIVGSPLTEALTPLNTDALYDASDPAPNMAIYVASAHRLVRDA